MKFLYGADWHFRSSTPRCRKDTDFYQTQLSKLKAVCKLAHELQIDYVLQGGDFFDTFDPTLRLIHDVMDILKDSRVKWVINPGNHDMFGENTNTLKRSGLGILEQADLVSIFYEKTDFDLGDASREVGSPRHVRALPYSQIVNPRDYHFETKIPGDVYIIMNHHMVTNHFVPYQHTLISNIKTNANLVLCSHWHAQFIERHNGVLFVNPGPLTRQTTHEARLTPSVALIEIQSPDNIKAELIPLPHQPAASVIDTSTTDQPSHEGLAEQFLEIMKSTVSEATDRYALVRHVGESNNYEPSVIENAIKRMQETELALTK